MAASKNVNLDDLYKCPWFFGEISEEEAKEILTEAKQNDENSVSKTIFFLKTVLWSPDQPRLKGKKHFTIVSGQLWQHDTNVQPQFTIRHEHIWFSAINSVKQNPFKNSVMRKNPFSLEELAKVKTVTSGVNVKTLVLPEKIKDELKKYQALNESFISAMISKKSQFEMKSTQGRILPMQALLNAIELLLQKVNFDQINEK